jgi:homoserine kinase type II
MTIFTVSGSLDELVPRVLGYYREALAAAYPRIQPHCSPNSFSGTRLWQVMASSRSFGLRCWPEDSPPRAHLQWIADVLAALRERRIDYIPVPVCAATGERVVGCGGRLWQLEPWLPGRSDFHATPSAGRLMAAMTALAALHNASATIAAPSGTLPTREPSPTVADRLAQVRAWRGGGLDRLVEATQRLPPGAMKDLAQQVARLAPLGWADVESRLAPLTAAPTHVMPVIRDLWHDHVLFDEERLTGIVDFGAMRIDSPAADIARLVASLVGDDRARWNVALESYQSVRSLSALEHRLIDAFHASANWLAALNWAQWLVVDQRVFASFDRALARWRECLAQMPGSA